MSPRLLMAPLIGLMLPVWTACSTSATTSAGNDGGVDGNAGAWKEVLLAGDAGAASDGARAVEPPKFEFHEDDFTESDRSRDPFRSFARVFSEQSKSHVKSQRQVLLDQFSVEELKLVGLVTQTDEPRAMLIDPKGKGWVVVKGQFIGRSEIIHGGQGSVDYELNWRVDRIRDGDIVLVREDLGHPEVAASTRILPLRTESADGKGK